MAQLREESPPLQQAAPTDSGRSPLTPALSPPGRGGTLWALQAKLSPYLFVAPFAILFSVFIVYPLFRSFQLSFYKTIGPAESRFVGLDNYRFLATDQFMWLALAQTIGYAIAFISIQIPTALLLAVLLDSPRVRARPLFRFAFFSTHLVGSVFVAILFAQILSPRRGLLNDLLGVQVDWLSSPSLALPAVLMAGLWLSVGYAMIYFVAALQSVDRELYEAAQVDGAGRWSQFWHITLPGIRPVLVFMILVSSIGALQLFELPYVLFQQSPGPMMRALTVVMHLYAAGWTQGDLGYASAIGWTLVALILTLAIVQLRIARRMGET